MTLELQGLGRQPANWKSTSQPWESEPFEQTVSYMSFTTFFCRVETAIFGQCNERFLPLQASVCKQFHRKNTRFIWKIKELG